MIDDNKYFDSIYKSEQEKIEKKLKSSIKRRKPFSLYKPAEYILESGGKRLRPLLLLFSAKSINKNIDVYNAAASVELLHNFTLVHDDIMDNADKRRGRLTLHKKYDINTAILTGDSLLAVAYENLLKDCEDNSKEILSAFTNALVEVCEGQSLDKEFETRKYVSLKEYIFMIRKKTAALSEMCCRIGGLLARGTKEQINALSNFGKNVGIAFQIQDDLLDIIGDEKRIGKAVGGDLIEGKKTYLFIKALEKAKGNDKKYLLKVIEKKGIKKNQIKRYKELYIKLGILEDAKNDVKKYSKKALSSIKILNKKDQEIFYWLTDSLLKRNK